MCLMYGGDIFNDTKFKPHLPVKTTSYSMRDCGFTRWNLTGVVVALSSLARILGECSTIHSPPMLFFFKWRLARAH